MCTARRHIKLTFAGKIEKGREILAVWHSCAFLLQLVEEWVHHGLHSAQPRSRRIFQEFGHQVNGLGRRAWPENLGQISMTP